MSGGGGGLRRVVRPQTQYKALTSEQEEERSRLLSRMGAFYVDACGRLGVRGRVVTLARLFDAGLCFGLLDPVSNILVNTLATTDVRPDDGTNTKAAAPLPLPSLQDKLPELGRRSLDGLSAFLLHFFPYLAAWEAVRYLLRADADLLVAARLVVADRGMTNFSIASPTSVLAFEGALGLAARLAGHPDLHRLLCIWVSLSTRLPEAVNMISQVQGYRPHDTITYRLRDWLLQKPRPSPSPPAALDLMQSWDLAAAPHGGNSITTDDMFSYKHLRALRMMLLNTVHVFYLRALARLPRNELRRRYHRSLHMAGSCYGPFDPVSNIILNTIWYHVNFPAAELPMLDMVGPLSLNRIESRSFFGRTRYTSLSEHETLQCLTASNADLSRADPKLNVAGAGEEQRQHPRYHQGRSSCYLSSTNLPGLCSAIRKVEQQTPCTSTQEAYEAAAVAAWHPNPEAQALFLSSVQTVLEESVLSMLQGRDSLTSEDVCYIADLLSPNHIPVPEEIKSDFFPVIAGKMRFEAKHERICRKVKFALDTCLDPILFAGLSTAKIRMMPYLFLLAPSAGKCPILFFAEFGNKDDDDVPLMCCHVDAPTPFAEHVRCLYCEAQGARIVHPSLEKFCGGEEFGEVIQGERYFTNDRLICKSEYFVQSLGGNEEDFILEVFFHNPSSHNALFIKAISQVPTSPIQAELIALQMAMEAVAFIHCTEVAFLTDNFQLADAIQKGDFLQDPPF
uniref:RNase H type-1 domain-containing protein n=1 Tax=Oryza glumipatula TaxID=40148 RepID=A0A0E0B780_9ORYZ